MLLTGIDIFDDTHKVFRLIPAASINANEITVHGAEDLLNF